MAGRSNQAFQFQQAFLQQRISFLQSLFHMRVLLRQLAVSSQVSAADLKVVSKRLAEHVKPIFHFLIFSSRLLEAVQQNMQLLWIDWLMNI